MSCKYLTLFYILLVMDLAIASQVERKCVNKKSYNDGCNNCFCSNGHIACTMRACEVRDPATGEYVPKPVQQPPEDFWEPQRFMNLTHA